MSAPAGTVVWTDTETLTLRNLVRYAGASGDFNPIHYDGDFARSRGLPSVIAHGMFSTGIIARLVRAHAGRPLQFDRISSRFVGVLVPDREILFTCYEIGDGTGGQHNLIVDARHSGAENPSVLCSIDVTDL
jgi:hydroxyacyl-ACP dehydratase HTD2-like protein with hotdog domain